jgi:hypothetical protein
MTNRFLISVAAAALIAGTGFANAQGTGGMEKGGAGAATTQQSAPSERGAPSATNRDSGSDTKGGLKGEKSAQDSKGAAGKDMKAEGREGSKNAAEGREGQGREGSKNAQSREGMSKEGMSKDGAQSKDKSGMSKDSAQSREGMSKDGMSRDSAQSKEGRPSGTTTGNAATSATAAPPAEKRTQIVSAIRSERIEETTNVNFNISVGATVPANVRFYPLPPRIVEIYPEWSGYEVIRVHGRYIIVRPQTHEIVYIIEG